ncbi:uncharacterized protein [Dermacentor albipictus]|uniref:uncharacterized protein n=1 Tax=Dermacentor albipictus TaxID=60249 RepID=UPI0038FC51F6
MSKPRPRRMYKQRSCFVPLCTTGYRPSTKRISMFSAPRDPARLSEWETRIRRADKRLTPAAVVCERHFEDSCIERTFKIVVDGVVNEIARDIPRLKPNAVPTVFEDYSAHPVPKKPFRRKAISFCEQEAAHGPGERDGEAKTAESCFTLDEESESRDDVSFSGESARSAESEHEEHLGSREGEADTTCEKPSGNGCTSPNCRKGHPFNDIQIPKTWTKVPCLSEGSLAYGCCQMQENIFSHLFIERMVVFGAASPDQAAVTATVYLRGRESFKEVLTTRCEAEEFIKDIDAVSLCNGCGVKPTSSKCTSYREMYFAEKCLIIAGSKGESCVRCKHARKLAQRKICKVKNKGSARRPEI